jgi:hypothetical protein
MHEAAEFGIAGFLYVPMEDLSECKGLLMHSTLMVLYEPVNWVDRNLLGTPGSRGGLPKPALFRRTS